MHEFNDKNVLIIGSERGIGKAVKEQLYSAGANVIGTSRHADGQDSIKHLDLADSASVDAFCHWLEQDFSYDVVIYCAGIIFPEPADKITTATIDDVMAVNLHAPIRILALAGSLMGQRGGGKIVGIGSIASIVSKPNSTVYSGSKAGFVGALRSLAVELASCGVLINTLSPGPTLTDMVEEWLSDSEQRVIAEQIPIQRLAQPEEIAQACVFLCSTANTYITGQNIIIDGGFTSK
ncbi:SDR family oxidoreductase [Alteromonas sp. ASW11-36]|uniref:SDR family oxidoreductase n=1 Tax=Alteromonas arenosi TaxID=3055817 RepID=A0ABT7SVC8_9ALTE|nr:SDR family oxidoreductase [Alteromonas sp. ASW11-36]MDM7860133.1 SDR family oxidoreductase [Alteromonas sp. ASW11-36]